MKVLLLTLLSVVVSTLAHPDYSESFEEFKEKFGKEYESDEEEVIFGQTECIISCSNGTRFPKLCYENGGGSFLIPYLVAFPTLTLKSIN